jgi:hypothetical protein
MIARGLVVVNPHAVRLSSTGLCRATPVAKERAMTQATLTPRESDSPVAPETAPEPEPETAPEPEPFEEPYLILGRPVEDRSFEAVEAGAGLAVGAAVGSVAGPIGTAIGGLVGAAAGLIVGEAVERAAGRAATTMDAEDPPGPPHG